jgi:hypothetical protein
LTACSFASNVWLTFTVKYNACFRASYDYKATAGRIESIVCHPTASDKVINIDKPDLHHA